MSKFHKITLGIIAVLMLLAPVMAFAEVTDAEVKADRSHNNLLSGDGLYVGTSETGYTTGHKVTNSDHHGLFVRVTSDGAVDITITFENSLTKAGTYVLPDGATWTWNITSTGDHIKALTGMAHVGWMRFKCVGAAGNDASGLVDVVYVRDEKVE